MIAGRFAQASPQALHDLASCRGHLGFPTAWSIGGAPSTPRARCATCWSSPSEISMRRETDAQTPKKCGFVLDRLITDDLRSYGAAAHDLGISTPHERGRWKNNRVENSHQPTRQRERKMQRFKSLGLSAKISLRSRCRLQYLQRPDFRFNASHFPGRGDGSCLESSDHLGAMSGTSAELSAVHPVTTILGWSLAPITLKEHPDRVFDDLLGGDG